MEPTQLSTNELETDEPTSSQTDEPTESPTIETIEPSSPSINQAEEPSLSPTWEPSSMTYEPTPSNIIDETDSPTSLPII